MLKYSAVTLFIFFTTVLLQCNKPTIYMDDDHDKAVDQSAKQAMKDAYPAQLKVVKQFFKDIKAGKATSIVQVTQEELSSAMAKAMEKEMAENPDNFKEMEQAGQDPQMMVDSMGPMMYSMILQFNTMLHSELKDATFKAFIQKEFKRDEMMGVHAQEGEVVYQKGDEEKTLKVSLMQIKDWKVASMSSDQMPAGQDAGAMNPGPNASAGLGFDPHSGPVPKSGNHDDDLLPPHAFKLDRRAEAAIKKTLTQFFKDMQRNKYPSSAVVDIKEFRRAIMSEVKKEMTDADQTGGQDPKEFVDMTVKGQTESLKRLYSEIPTAVKGGKLIAMDVLYITPSDTQSIREAEAEISFSINGVEKYMYVTLLYIQGWKVQMADIYSDNESSQMWLNAGQDTSDTEYDYSGSNKEAKKEAASKDLGVKKG